VTVVTRAAAVRKAASLIVLVLFSAHPALAQQNLPRGYVSLFTDYFPNKSDTVELRARAFAEQTFEPAPPVAITLSGFAEGLLARRPQEAGPGSLQNVGGGIVRLHDANVTLTRGRLDVLAGYGRTSWGKLDEIQPTDVINPLDVSRFFFEGRSEARLSTVLVRGRFHPNEDVTLEAVYVPDFRRGRFDQLDEPTSPFNLPLTRAGDPAVCLALGCPPLAPAAIDAREPPFALANGQGGGRLSLTSGRVDWSVSAYRGIEPFGLYRIVAGQGPPTSAAIALEYPRFTMIGGDFEAVRGKWGMRAEVAAFVDDSFQSPELRIVPGRSIDAGAGVDRRAGDYTVSATVLFHAESYETPLAAASREDGRHDVSIVGSADRTFAREKYRLRTFAVYNATESSGFLRVIGMASLRDNVSLESSLGWFAGGGRDLVGRFGDSDFLYIRMKYYF
jgi:hypothetical protein